MYVYMYIYMYIYVYVCIYKYTHTRSGLRAGDNHTVNYQFRHGLAEFTMCVLDICIHTYTYIHLPTRSLKHTHTHTQSGLKAGDSHTVTFHFRNGLVEYTSPANLTLALRFVRAFRRVYE